MFEASIEARFNAVHRVRCADGSLEPLHGHDWVVRAHFARCCLDKHDMVVDFAHAHAAVRAAIASLHHRNLNEHEAFDGRNPTAERVAHHVFGELVAGGLTTLRRVEVTEEPGCVAAYEPPEPPGGSG